MATATAPSYPAYRPSGHDWIGDIPAEWEVTKLGACLKVVSEKNHPDLPLLSITREQGVIERDVDDQESNHNFIPDDLSGYKLIKAGQFGMNKMKAWQGSYGVSRHTGIVSPAYFIFDFTKPIDPDFFHLAIRGKLYVSYFASASDGVRIGQWDLSKPRMREIPFVLPPIDQQRDIVRFLNEKTAKIDDAVALEERQIALLKERKQIVIQNAVTKGLNPNAPKKDSGVDWIGEIPAHWGVFPLFSKTRIKSVSNCADRDLLSVYLDLGVVKFSDVEEKRTNVTSLDLSAYQAVDPGDFVLNNQQAWRGSVGVSMHTGIVSPAYIVLSLSSDFDPEFANYYFRSPALVSHYLIGSKGVGTIQRNLYWPKLRTTPISIPPIDEQIAIVMYIRTEAAKIDRAISLKNDQIAALREYKATLINSAVTGKIKVA